MRRFIGATLVVVVSLACHDRTMAESKSTALTPADLDSLLAPVALYPDQLLAQMLLSAAEPAKVVALHTWLQSNAALKGTALQDAATVEGFEPNFVAMAIFPNVVKFMAEQLDWTTRLGKAFAADRPATFASIQRLRKNAYAKGTLKTTPQQQVETTTTAAGDQVIVIEPANPQIVYVPQYNPQVVYTHPPATTTTVVIEEDDDDAEAIAAGLIGFTAGIAIGAAIDNDYYYGPYGWHGGVHMYNDAWDDWYDAREDAREDWVDHREDLVEERGERVGEAREQRTERTAAAGQQRTERTETRQQSRTDRTQTRQDGGAVGTAGYEARGHSGGSRQTATERSGARSDAFSGYSSGSSTRASSARGQSSRSSSRGGGGRRR